MFAATPRPGGSTAVDVLGGANPLDEIAEGRYKQMIDFALGAVTRSIHVSAAGPCVGGAMLD